MNKNKTIKIICSLLLLIAFLDNPYSYYQVLRWVVSIISFYLAHSYFKNNNEKYGWIFISVGILFNPIFPFYFEKSIWKILDIVALGIFLFSLKK